MNGFSLVHQRVSGEVELQPEEESGGTLAVARTDRPASWPRWDRRGSA